MATLGKIITLEDTSVNVEMVSSESIGADLTNELFRNQTVYFSAPAPYLGKKLTSYGGALNYSIFYTPGLFGELTDITSNFTLELQLGRYYYKLTV